MSLLKKLFGPKFQSKTIEVSGVGSMSNDKYGDWMGKKRIPFLNKEIDLTISAEEVSDAELKLIKEIEDEFEILHEDLRKELFKDLDDFEDGTTMKQVFDSLDFEHINIHNPSERMWELSATTELDDHIFNIQFRGLQFEGFSMDG